MSDRKILTVFITEEEQAWIRKVAKANRSTITLLIIRLLEKRSKELNIALPEKRYARKTSRQPQTNQYIGKAKFMARIDKELGLL